MLVVAYLSTMNGMASWCWEAAHALAEAGQPVLLVCDAEVSLPATPGVEVLRFTPEPDPPGPWLRAKLDHLAGKSTGFVGKLHRHLEERNITPSAYVLVQSDLQDPSVATAQYVTGWAYPPTLWGYLTKIPKYNGSKLNRNTLGIARGWIVWWRKDWRAYRSATAVMAVTHRLQAELSARGVAAHVVHPGTHTLPVERAPQHGPCKVLFAALDLEEERKRVRWMIQALKRNPQRNYTVTLVGQATAKFQEWVCGDQFPARFTGHVRRDEVQQMMAEHDVFCFGSCLDDWGYVLVEAVSQGLCVLAPRMTPFDEIVGDTGALYAPYSQADFAAQFYQLVNGDYHSKQQAALRRAQVLFSRPAFGRSLLAAVPK